MADAGGGGVLRDGNGAFCGGSHAATAVAAGTGAAAAAAATLAEAWKEWDDKATCVLLDLYTERYLALQRGTLRAKEWQEVVDGLNAQCAAGKPVYNYNRCKNKIDSLKKTFKTVREKRRLGTPVKWKWYNRIERITAKASGAGAGGSGSCGDSKVAAGIVEKQQQQQQQVAAADQFVDHTEFDDGIGGSDDALVSLNGIQEELMMRTSFCSPPPPPRFGIPGQDQQQQQWSQHDHNQQQGKEPGSKKRKGVASSSSGGGEQQQQQQLREVAQMMIECVERMEERRQMLEEKRLEVFKELQQKRNETQWEIAKLIIDANHQARFFHQHSTNPGD